MTVVEPLKIALFGTPALSRAGREIFIEAPPKTIPLFAYILLHRRNALDRTALASLFWPDEIEGDARANLRRHLYYLKKSLPEDQEWLLLSKNGVRWNLDAPFWLDVAAFETFSKSDALRSDAAQLYTGDLYERCEEEWIFYDRERLKNLQVANLQRLCAGAVEVEDYASAISFTRALLALDPWREDVIRELMTLRARSGDRAGGVAEYELFAQRLDADIQAQPMEETTALYERLRSPGPVGRPAVTIREPAAKGPETDELYGRENELQVLERLLELGQAARGACALIGGEAGVGKTALVLHAAGRARAAGMRVLTGSASMTQVMPYDAFVDAMRMLGGPAAARHAGKNVDILAQIAPEIFGNRPASTAPAAYDDQGLQSKIFAAIADLVSSIAAEQPLMLVLEDLHWSGSTTALLFEYLARTLAHRQFVLVGTYRDEELWSEHPLRFVRRMLSKSASFVHLVLNNLDQQAVLQLSERALGRERTRAVLPGLWEMTEGNPLLLQTALQEFEQSGALHIPAPLKTMLERRSASLEPQTRTVLYAAAVLGKSFDEETVVRLTGLPLAHVMESANELCAQRLVRTQLTGASAGYTFAHSAFQELVYEQIDVSVAQRLHARIAMLVENGQKSRKSSGIIAFHYDRAGMPERALPHYIEAAEHALDVHANCEALEFAERALQAGPDETSGVRIALVLEEAARRKADRTAQRKALEDISDIIASVNDSALVAEFRKRETLFMLQTDRLDEAERQLALLEDVAPTDSLWNGHISHLRGMVEHRHGKLAIAARSFRAAADSFTQAGCVIGRTRCYVALVRLAIVRGENAERYFDEVRRSGIERANPSILAELLKAECEALLPTDPRKTIETADRMLEAAVAAGDLLLQADAHYLKSRGCSIIGEFSALSEELDKARAIYETAGSVKDRVRVLLTAGLNAALTLDQPNGFRLLEKALAIANEWRLSEERVMALSYLGMAHAWLDDTEKAVELELSALKLSDEVEYYEYRPFLLVNAGGRLVHSGRYDEAIPLLLEFLRMAGKHGGERLRAIVASLLAQAYARRGEAERGRQWAQEAISIHESTPPIAWFVSNEYWFTALAYRILGRNEEAARLAREAHEVVLRQASKLPSSQREAFLNTPFHRSVFEAAEHGRWAKLTVIAVDSTATAKRSRGPSLSVRV